MRLTMVDARTEGRYIYISSTTITTKTQTFLEVWLYMKDICIAVTSISNLCVTREERFVFGSGFRVQSMTLVRHDRTVQLLSHTAGEEG